MGLSVDSATGLPLLNAQGDAGALPLPRVGDLERTAAKAGAITTSIEKVIQWGRYSSLWPALFGLACCAIEMMATGAARYDMSRFGCEVFRASPRQADLMIVAGRVSQKMGPVLRQIYEQMPEPKWVISMGACASSGGMFNNYAIIQGVDKVVPVDIYLPGCPPRPEGLLDAVLKLQTKIAAERPSSLRG
jgi:NADH-quinone oxidoreductase subunit B